MWEVKSAGCAGEGAWGPGSVGCGGWRVPAVGGQLRSWQRKGPDKSPGQSAHLTVLLAEDREAVSEEVKLAVRAEDQVKDTQAQPWRKARYSLSDEPAAESPADGAREAAPSSGARWALGGLSV